MAVKHTGVCMWIPSCEPTTIAPQAMVAVVEAWMPVIRSKMANQSVKKNLTVPKWLADAADRADINYSQVLQEALKSRLGVPEEPADYAR